MTFFDQNFTTLFATAVLHFLWLACLPWSLLIVVDWCVPKKNETLRYSGNLICLFAIVAMVPVSFWIAGLSGTPDATEVNPVSSIDYVANAVAGQAQATTSTEIQPSQSTGAHLHAGMLPATETAAGNIPSLTLGDRFVSAFKSWAVVVFIVYLVGVVVCSIRFARGLLGSRRLRIQATEIKKSSIRGSIQRVSQRLQFQTEPVVLWCTETAVPMVVGVLRPVVLLPVAWATDATSQQIEHVLMHEFIHLRRLDPLWNCLQNTIETLLFFHPVVWRVSHQVRLHREISCDAAVVQEGADAYGYAKTLTDVAASVATSPAARQALRLSVPATSGQSELRLRVERLLGKPTAATKNADAASFALLVMTVAFLATLFISPGISAANDEPDDRSIEMKLADLESLAKDEFAGVVQDVDGNPIEGATVDVWHWNPGDEAKTDADGFFRFKPSCKKFDQKVEVRISKLGYSPYYNHLQEIGQKDFVVTLNQATYVEGMVSDANGNPAAEVKLVFDQGPKRSDGVSLSTVISETQTDADGKYRIYLAPDSYSVLVQSAAGVARTSVKVKPKKAAQLDLKLREGARLEATVVDTLGKPYEGLVLFTWQEPKMTAVSGSDGKIVIEGLVPGEMEFNVGSGELVTYRGMSFYQHGELGRWWSEAAVRPQHRYTLNKNDQGWQRNFDRLRFDIKKGMAPVKIVVERGVTFEGHVYDPDGNPVAGATVAPAKTGSGNSLTGDTRYSVKTKKDGSYQVVMPAGNEFKYNLMVHDGDYQQWRQWANGVTEPVETKPGQIITGFDLKLTRGATVRGSITNPRRGLEVRAVSSDLHGNRYYSPRAKVAADGTFEIKFIRAGSTHIQVSPFWMNPEHAPAGTSHEVILEEGEVLEGIQLTAADEQ